MISTSRRYLPIGKTISGIAVALYSSSLFAYGTLTASRDVVDTSDGKAHSVHITKHAPGEGVVQIWVDVNNQGEKLMSQGTADSPVSKHAPWIAGKNRTYEFLLYKGTNRAKLLDVVTVKTGKHQPNEDSFYLETSGDIYVDGRKTLLSKTFTLDESQSIYFQSDGRYFPFGGKHKAAIKIFVNGTLVSNKSQIDWDNGNGRQHSFNVIGVAELPAGSHTVTLEAEGGTFKVGSNANLSVLINPAPIVNVATLNTPFRIGDINTSDWTPKNGDPIKTQSLFSKAFSTGEIALDNESMIALSSGTSYSYFGKQGDAMFSIGLDGQYLGSDVASSGVNDICGCAEYRAPMYSHAFFDAPLVGPSHTIDFLAGEFPWKSSNTNTQNLIYLIDSSAKLITLGGGLQVAGSATTKNYDPNKPFHQWEYQRVGGYHPQGPQWTGTTLAIASAEIVIPEGHNGVVMFTAKSRIQGGRDDNKLGIGTTSLWITIDGKRRGSQGVQQLAHPFGVSQRTLSASYLATGANRLSEGTHTVKVFMRTQGDMKWPSTHEEAVLAWFD